MNPYGFLRHEAHALLTRLEHLSPFALNMPMTTAAAISDDAMRGIDQHLNKVKRSLRSSIGKFLSGLDSAEKQQIAPEKVQTGYALLKLRFNQILDQLDIFADVLSQRAEHETGVWVAGLDALAADAVQLPGRYYTPPPLICFLERGHGAAIRRARTRLPGGDLNPVAVIQVPRERMVGSGIGASLVHEVGHQGAALLELVESLQALLQQTGTTDPVNAPAWKLYERWISEIAADLWALGHLGIGATQGLMGVVSLPRYFVFRLPAADDPHPFPWIRVKISIAFGKLLFPHPQWDKLDRLWELLYPIHGLTPPQAQTVQQLLRVLPRFVQVVANHRSKRWGNRRLAEIFPIRSRQPSQLMTLFQQWQRQPELWLKQPPSLVFAVAGQARTAGQLTPQLENKLLTRCLTHWAIQNREPHSPPKPAAARPIIHQ